jgi:hypothetical protein
MADEARVVVRDEQPYAGIRELVTVRTLGSLADRIPEILEWLADHGIEPSGAPFFKYNVIDMEGELEVEAGVPVAETFDAIAPVFSGVLPGGRFVTLTHIGDPDDLVRVTGDLLAWAAQQGLAWDMTRTERGESWGCRLEFYKTDPTWEPDMTTWETELAFRLAQ